MANRYELLRKLGAGGMGMVYLARQRGDGGFERLVALKRLSPQFVESADVRTLFEREVRLGSQLIHPNVVQVVDASISGPEPYLATEFVDGGDLEAVLAGMRKTGARLPPTAIAYIGSQVCQALAFMAGLRDEAGAPLVRAHRDVSPGNVLVSRSGAVKLADFGVARLTTSQTSAAVVRGKWQYFPPEISSQDPDIRGDLFALGLVLYQLVSLQHPFEAPTAQGYYDRASLVEPPRPPEIPDGLWAILSKALAKTPEKRYPTPEAMGEALDAFIFAGGQPMTASVLARLVEPLLPPPVPTTPDPKLAQAQQAQATAAEPELSGTWQPQGPALGADGRIEGLPARASSRTPAPVARPAESEPALELVSTAESHADVARPAGLQSLSEVRKVELHEGPLHPRPPRNETVYEPPRARSKWPGRALLVLALGLIGAGAWGLLRPHLPLSPSAEGSAPLVWIESEPGGAEVYSGNERLGATPFAFPNEYPDGQAVLLTVKKHGFEPAEIGFPGGRPNRLVVKLKHAR